MDRPQLIASNHPNGFLEPLVMACFFPKDLHFLVRGDVFDNKFLKPILTSTHQIPIFRFRDGFSKLRENSQTMDESIQVLLDNKNLLIFAEGGTESIKKLRSLQKGIARIAFQALDKNPELPLEILPIGINFTYPTKFNKEVMMRVGEPLFIQPYYKMYLQDKNRGVEALLSDLYDRMKDNIIHIAHQERIHVFEKLVLVKRSKLNLSILPVYISDTSRLDNEQLLASMIDNLTDEKLDSLKLNIKSLELEMKKNKVLWNDIIKQPLNVWNSFILVVGIIPAAIGLLINGIPIAFGYLFTKSQVKQKEFKASILMVVTLVMLLLQYIIMLLLVTFGFVSWIILLIGILSGLWLKFYYTVFENTYFNNSTKLKEFKTRAINLLDDIK